MNDFTKEELVLLACWSINRCEQIGIDQAKDERTIALSHKIQDMIVNYCKHEYNDIRYAVIKLKSNDERDFEYKCGKCNKVLFQY